MHMEIFNFCQIYKKKSISHEIWNTLKVGFFEKVMAKFSNLSNRHTCEPKIVSELLFPVNIVTTI